MEVISTRRYEARPAADSHASMLVDPANSVATVKEEEWETRKKKEITTTRQIETRVKRQVVLEDGEVVVDSGPLVTTNTKEDVEQQEHTTQERRTTGDEPRKLDWPNGAKPGALVQRELNETTVKSREEVEELLETEDRQQLGDITDEAYLRAVRNNRGDLRTALAESRRQLQRSHQQQQQQQQQGSSPEPRVLRHTTRSNKVVDTEKTLERSELKEGGQIVTERKTTVEHEEIKDDELPEELEGRRRRSRGGARDEVLDEGARESRKEASQRYCKTRDEDIVDYVRDNGERVAREMRFVSEQTEAERTGDWPTEGVGGATTPQASGAPGLRGPRLTHGKHGFPGGVDSPAPAPSPTSAAAAAARKDALTRKPLDLEEEDEARKFETSKWLESHFGSESRSSQGSLDDFGGDDNAVPTTTSATSFINVTMKSACAPKHHKQRQQQQQQQQHQQQQQQQQSTKQNGRGSSSPSGYFQGISEWSERYQSTTEKQNSYSSRQSKSPSPYVVVETAREARRESNGRMSPATASPSSPTEPGNGTSSRNQQHRQKETSYSSRTYESSSSSRRRHHPQQHHHHPDERRSPTPPLPPLSPRLSPPPVMRHHVERGTSSTVRVVDPPSPPMRRKAREQVITTKSERTYQHESISPRPGSADRSASPVHVVQRTWESRNRDSTQQHHNNNHHHQQQQQQQQQQQHHHHNNHNNHNHYQQQQQHHYHHQQHEERRSRGGSAGNGASTVDRATRRSSSPGRTRPRPRSPDSRSISPSPGRRDRADEEHARPSKSPSPSKYKIGESFRKLVGKFRSASSERRNKRPPSGLHGSNSHLTQTDDGGIAGNGGSTYLQYNSVDRNVPLGPDYDDAAADDRPPERPPRSPRHHMGSTTSINIGGGGGSGGSGGSGSGSGIGTPTRYHHGGQQQTSGNSMMSSSHQVRYKSSRSSSPRRTEYRIPVTRSDAATHQQQQQQQQRSSPQPQAQQQQQQQQQPIHRYYLGEDPFGGSIYGKEKGYKETRHHSSRYRGGRPIDEEYSAQPSSLGRFSKSTSRLANEFERSEYERTSSAQTLPRKIHQNHHLHGSTGHLPRATHEQHEQQQHRSSSSTTTRTTTTTRRTTNGLSSTTSSSSSPVSRFHASSSSNNNGNGNGNNHSSNGNNHSSNGNTTVKANGIGSNGHSSSLYHSYNSSSSSSNNNNNNSSSSYFNNNNNNSSNGKHSSYINSKNITNNNNNNNYEPPRQYGSMINISFKNTVTSTPKTTHYVQTTINTHPPPLLAPRKPERTYKSTLSRSKSFNVEIADDGIVSAPRDDGANNGYAPRTSYGVRSSPTGSGGGTATNGIKVNGPNGIGNGVNRLGSGGGSGVNARTTSGSSSQLNLLGETAPLKSPGILASISRGNRESSSRMMNGGRTMGRDY